MVKMKKIIILSLISLLFLSFLISIALYHDATHAALTRLKIERISIRSQEIPESLNGLDLLYFSDVHLFSSDNQEFISEVFDTIHNEYPNIILFGGDLIDASLSQVTQEQRDMIDSQLDKLDANLGIFAVLGEDDLKHIDLITELYSAHNIEILDGTSTLIRTQDDQGLCLSNLKGPCEGSDYTLALQYDPNDYSSQLNADLVLLAKTHGGQVNLPFFGPSYSKATGPWIKGFYQNHQSLIYVSAGIASLEFQARLFNDPSLYVFTFESK